jgi:DNA-binding response OmpR family regulator
MHTIAVVEDNAELRTDLVEFLHLRGFNAQGFESAESFFLTWSATTFSLLLLDVALPGASGLEIAQRVRAQNSKVGIIMLTALDANADQVQGLNLGADIYLSKRSSLDVIEAACHSVLRRLGHVQQAIEYPSSWILFVSSWKLQMPNGASLTLTQTEAILLTALFGQSGQAISREALLLHLDKPETLSNLRNLDNTVSRLRRKVQTACGVELPMRSGYGRGYTFVGQGEIAP